MGTLDFCIELIKNAQVAVSPGVGFGPGGEGFVRFALIENEHRIAQALRTICDSVTVAAVLTIASIWASGYSSSTKARA